MKIFIRYIKKYKWILIAGLFFAAINQIFSLLNPQVFRLIIDNYASNITEFTRDEFIRGVGLLVLLYIGVAFISRTAKAFQDYFVNVVSERVATRIYNTSIEHIFHLPFALFEDEQSGSVLQKLQRARDHAKKFILDMVSVGFFSFVGMVFVITYAYMVHWIIGTIFLASIPLLGAIMYVVGRTIRTAQQGIVRRSAELAASTTETLQNVGLVKALGLEDQEIDRLNTVHEDILDLELKKVIILRRLSFIQGTLINLVSTLIVFASMMLIFQGAITLGEFLALWFYGFFVFGPLGQLPEVMRSYQETRASMDEVEAIITKQHMQEAHEKKPALSESLTSVTFNDVSFSYSSSDHPSLHHVSLTLTEGATIALVGPSGSGKSTCIKLLLGLYTPDSGDVLYNEAHMADIDMQELRSRIGYVPQDTQVFAGTIRENLTFVAPHASDEECITALHNAQAQSILDRSQEGLDTRIGEHGIKLSGGERQRIAIARALLRDPEILIFDEATSSLDTLTEQEITQTIAEIKKKRPSLMMLIIAHRLSTIEHADTIYVLRKGEIVESGNHHKLLEKKDLYYSLWNQQQ